MTMASESCKELEALSEKELNKLIDKKTKETVSKEKKKELYEAKEWYTIRALLGNTWANWFILAGARERPLNAVRHSQYKILY